MGSEIAAGGVDRLADHDELVKRAAALRQELWSDAEANDRDRRLTDATIAGVVDAGLTRLLTPIAFGGHGTDMRTLLQVGTELGKGCSSTAWVTSVLNAGNFVVSLYGQQAQADVWGADPLATAALVLGMPCRGVEVVDGGIVVTGQWGYASGSWHCEWINVLVLVPGVDGPPRVHFALLPMSDVEVRDTWFFTGMRGTGSNTVVADGVFVPSHRLLPYQPVLDGETDGVVEPGHLYRNSLTGLFMVGLIGSMIGGAEAAYQYVAEHAAARPVAGSTYKCQVDSPTLQLDLASAAMAIDTAKLHAARIADTVDAFARAGQNADLVTRARARMTATFVAERCREAIDILVTAFGTSAFAEHNPLQRIWRDINVGSRHAGFGMGIPHQVYGRALVGRDPRDISSMV